MALLCPGTITNLIVNFVLCLHSSLHRLSLWLGCVMLINDFMMQYYFVKLTFKHCSFKCYPLSFLGGHRWHLKSSRDPWNWGPQYRGRGATVTIQGKVNACHYGYFVSWNSISVYGAIWPSMSPCTVINPILLTCHYGCGWDCIRDVLS